MAQIRCQDSCDGCWSYTEFVVAVVLVVVVRALLPCPKRNTDRCGIGGDPQWAVAAASIGYEGQTMHLRTLWWRLLQMQVLNAGRTTGYFRVSGVSQVVNLSGNYSGESVPVR
jgi:hypothetical protein